MKTALDDHEIWRLIFWMCHRRQRHLHCMPHGEGPPEIIQAPRLYQREEVVKRKRIIEMRRWSSGVFCPICWELNKHCFRLTPMLPMYRKHLVNEAGDIVTIVHLSQCQLCWTILWASVGVLNYDLVELKLLAAPKKRKPRRSDHLREE